MREQGIRNFKKGWRDNELIESKKRCDHGDDCEIRISQLPNLGRSEVASRCRKLFDASTGPLSGTFASLLDSIRCSALRSWFCRSCCQQSKYRGQTRIESCNDVLVLLGITLESLSRRVAKAKATLEAIESKR
jgi:hypothetical protein